MPVYLHVVNEQAQEVLFTEPLYTGNDSFSRFGYNNKQTARKVCFACCLLKLWSLSSYKYIHLYLTSLRAAPRPQILLFSVHSVFPNVTQNTILAQDLRL